MINSCGGAAEKASQLIPSLPVQGIRISGALTLEIPYSEEPQCQLLVNPKVPSHPRALTVRFPRQDGTVVFITIEPYVGMGHYNAGQAFVTLQSGQFWQTNAASIDLQLGIGRELLGRVDSGTMTAREGPSTASMSGNWKCPLPS